MPAIFNAVSGSAIAIKTNKSASTLFSIGTRKPTQHAITTAVTYSQKVAVQFKPSLRRILFVFPFGDEPSQLAVTLSVFLRDCEGNVRSGVDDMLKYYDSIKLQPDASIPLSLTIGRSPIRAFCVGMDLSMQVVGLQTVASAQFHLVGWNLDIPSANG